MAVCIGAMMVGSILITKNEGEQVKRGEEFGYFAFGTLKPNMSTAPCDDGIL
jgi:phosphatidylserine decarboxylase